MKSNVFKSSIAAFAFAIAIVASFAFSPAFNNAEVTDDIIGYIQHTSITEPCEVTEVECSDNSSNPACTLGLNTLYDVVSTLGKTECTTQLYQEDNP